VSHFQPRPDCAQHHPLHVNEEVPLVGQRLLAELTCQLLVDGHDPGSAVVEAARTAYWNWCQRGGGGGAVPANDGTWRGWSKAPTPSRTDGAAPVSQECGVYEPERERIRAAIPVLDALSLLASADTLAEEKSDRARVARAVADWGADRPAEAQPHA
jgi:hypothetical protein